VKEIPDDGIPSNVLFDSRDGESIGEKGLVVSYGVDGSEQASDAFTLRHVAARSRGLGHIYHAGALVHGQQKNSDTRETFVNLSRRAEAVKNGHRNVQNHEVWTQLRNLIQRFQSIGGFSANLKPARLQNRPNSRTQRLVVVYN
jgi:hypothetical protein